MLLIICGALAAGKHEALRSLVNQEIMSINVQKKFTTRFPRIQEDSDIISVNALPPQCNLTYQICNTFYGIDINEIYQSLENGTNLAIIISDFKAINELKTEFKDSAKAIWIDRDISSKEFENHLKKYQPDLKVKFHLKMLADIQKNYDENRNLFDFTIMNNDSCDWINSQLKAFLLDINPALRDQLWPKNHVDSSKLKEIEHEFKLANEQIKRYFAKSPNDLHLLSPRKFENLIASILEDMGFKIELTPKSKDGGYDIRAIKKEDLGPILYLIECKKYAPHNRVGVELVRNLDSVRSLEKANSAVLVTTSHFTKGAQELQRRLGYQISLLDYDVLVDWFSRYLDE